MTRISTFDEVQDILTRHVPITKDITGKDITLDRMKPLMAALGNPHERLQIMHVAGTSGKTSTCYYLAALLAKTGRKVGLTVSPHIDSVTERVQINMQPLSEQTFAAAFSEYYQVVMDAELVPTYFELLVGFAYWYFDKTRVDVAVIETGLGGLHDGTNIANNPNKVCIITDIGLDHMHVLGNTVEQIAAQKAGIIHAGNPVYAYQQASEIMEVIETHCQEVGAQLHIQNELTLQAQAPHVPLADFQLRNWLLAYVVFRDLQEAIDLPKVSKEEIVQTARMTVPSRMDKVTIGDKTIIMDGAHNEQKMQAFVESFLRSYPDARIPVLLSLKLGKELLAVLPLVKQIASSLIITEYEFTQDMPVPAINAHELAAAAQKLEINEVSVITDPEEAYNEFMSRISDAGVITGSFYLIAQLRQLHKELIHGKND